MFPSPSGLYRECVSATNANGQQMVWMYSNIFNAWSFYFRNVTEKNVMAGTGGEGKSPQKRIQSGPPYFSSPIIGESRGSRDVSPLPVKFRSFSCSFQKRSCQIIGFCPKLRGWYPPILEILDPPLFILREIHLIGIKSF